MYMNIKRVVFKKVLSAFVLVFFMASFVASFSVYNPTKIANAACVDYGGIDIAVGSGESILIGTDLYVLTLASVSVIDITTDTVVQSINIGGQTDSQDLVMALVGTDIYIVNGGLDTVVVLDTNTNTVTDSISVGDYPRFPILVGDNLYVTNRLSDTVSVIDTNTNTVTGTITVGDIPEAITIVGTNLYVLNNGSDNVSIIDTNTNTVTNTVAVTGGPLRQFTSGNYIFIASGFAGPSNISVIDTDSNTVVSSIASPGTVNEVILANGSVYALTSSDILVIDPTTLSITETIDTAPMNGTGASRGQLIGTDLYISFATSDTVLVFDTNTNTLEATVDLEASFSPFNLQLIGTDLYVFSYQSDSVYIIDTGTQSLRSVCTPELSTATVNAQTLVLTYDEALDPDSVPSLDDFIVKVNGSPVSVSSLEILGQTITFILTTPVTYADTVTISYVVPGSGSVKNISGNDAAALTDSPVTNNTAYCGSTIPIDGGSYDLALAGDTLYVSNGNGSVLVFDSGSDALLETLSVGTAPVSATLVGDYLYVNDYGAGEVVVIDTTDNSISETIAGTSGIYSSTLVGTDLYINSPDTNSVYVLDTTTNTVTDTLIGFSTNLFSVLVGTDLYVSNSGDGTVSVVDTLTNTISETIAVGASIYSGTLVGTDLYFTDIGNAEVVVVDTSTNTVSDNIIVGSAPFSSTLVGTDLYVNESGSGNVSVIDTTSNTITDTIVTSSTPYVSTLVGLYLYVGTYDANITVIDTTTKALYVCGKKLVLNYVAGSNGSIIGDSYQIVNAGSNGTAVTAEGNGDYEFVGWSDDSTENPRTEINVRNNKTLTAIFAIAPPSVSSGGGSSSGTALYRVFINLMSMGKFDDAYRLVVNSPRSFTSEINAVVTFCDNAHFTNFMKKGDVDGKFSQYYQGQVEEISKLQDFVNHLFAYQYTRASGPVDSIFGSMTQGGVKILQSMLNRVMTLEQDLAVDGIVGPFTRAAVNDFCLP